MSFKEFQDGNHGLAILNLHVATMSPTKFQLNPTYGSGGDVEKSERLTTDGWTTDNRPWHKLHWSTAPGELQVS